MNGCLELPSVLHSLIEQYMGAPEGILVQFFSEDGWECTHFGFFTNKKLLTKTLETLDSNFFDKHHVTLYLVKDNCLIGPLPRPPEKRQVECSVLLHSVKKRGLLQPKEDFERRLTHAWEEVSHMGSSDFLFLKPQCHEIAFLFNDAYSYDLLTISLLPFSSKLLKKLMEDEDDDRVESVYLFCLQDANCFLLPHESEGTKQGWISKKFLRQL
jgi:hypothetical protein